MKRQSHNHGPDSGAGLACREHPVGACLVVIDPKDREQVRRLMRAMDVEFDGFPRETVTERDYAETQDALRSLIEPPKPEEPKGFGAVVEDAEGRMWVRTHHHWRREDLTGISWDDLRAVRVLSEGVTA